MIDRNLFPDPSEASVQSVLNVSEASLAGITSRQLADSLAVVLSSTHSGRLTFTDFCDRLDGAVVSLGDLLHHPCTMAAEEKSSYLVEKNRELTFHPRINPASAEKARDRWADPTAMWDVLHREREAVLAKRDEKRRAQEEAEVAACSFKPLLHTYRHGEPRYHFPNMQWLEEERRAHQREQQAKKTVGSRLRSWRVLMGVAHGGDDDDDAA